MQLTEYRLMREIDEEAVLDMWIEAWGGSDRDFARWELRSDPGYLEHTFLAVAPDGTVLSTSHYYLQYVRGEVGTPRLAGCLSHVTTRERARRQGHARRLVEMSHEGMRRDGCAYSLLFSSEMGMPLYEGMGYEALPSPYRRGLLSGERLESSGYAVRRYNPEAESGGWEALAPIYASYNKARPMSVVRERLNWDVIARRFEESFHGHSTLAYVASMMEGDTLTGYALAHFSTAEMARRTLDLDQVFTISELGVLPGHDGAIDSLLASVVGEAAPGKVGGRAFLPRDPVADHAIRLIFGDTLQDLDDRMIMALPLSEEMGYDDLRAMAHAPGAWFWLYDAF